MCGIFCLIDGLGIFKNNFVFNQFQKGKHRGPDNSQNLELGFGIKLGFHRLNINALDNFSDQPIIINNVALICNGEIYNYKELYKDLNIIPITSSDCEVIIHLYKAYGIEKTLQLIDGNFSFILYDMMIIDNESNKIFIARDPLGIRPLYVLRYKNNNINMDNYSFIFASELKMISEFYIEYQKNYNTNNPIYDKYSDNELSIMHFQPGTYSILEKKFITLSPWEESIKNKF